MPSQWRLTLRSVRRARLEGRAMPMQLTVTSGSEHVVGRLFGQREWARLGERDGGLECGHDLAFDAAQRGIVELTLVPELPLEQRDRIPALPRFALRRVAGIRLPFALGVGAPAVGLTLDQGRAAA